MPRAGHLGAERDGGVCLPSIKNVGRVVDTIIVPAYCYSMKTERRTQLYLTDSQYQAVLRLARARDTSLAAVVREAIDQYVAGVESEAAAPWAHDVAHDLVGSLELPPLPEDRSGGAGLNEAIDASVYDEG